MLEGKRRRGSRARGYSWIRFAVGPSECVAFGRPCYVLMQCTITFVIIGTSNKVPADRTKSSRPAAARRTRRKTHRGVCPGITRTYYVSPFTRGPETLLGNHSFMVIARVSGLACPHGAFGCKRDGDGDDDTITCLLCARVADRRISGTGCGGGGGNGDIRTRASPPPRRSPLLRTH